MSPAPGMASRPGADGAPIAVFDLDGTLTLTDTSIPFLRSAAGAGPTKRGQLWAGACFVPDLVVSCFLEWLGGGPKLGGVAGRLEGRLHERVAAITLRGRTRDELLAAGRGFAEAVVEGNLRPDARPRIQRHRDLGHRLVMVSASLDVYVEPVAALLGFDDAVGTRLDFVEGVATGRFRGLPCWGVEKVRRVQEVLGDGAEGILHAYGDSPGDAALLAAARHPTWVR